MCLGLRVKPYSCGALLTGGQVIFKVRRPFYFINSSIFVEDGEGKTIGEVQQRWHLWQRKYDLYIDRKQYATINSGLWAWEFLLKDKDGGDVLAECSLSEASMTV